MDNVNEMYDCEASWSGEVDLKYNVVKLIEVNYDPILLLT